MLDVLQSSKTGIPLKTSILLSPHMEKSTLFLMNTQLCIIFNDEKLIKAGFIHLKSCKMHCLLKATVKFTEGICLPLGGLVYH